MRTEENAAQGGTLTETHCEPVVQTQQTPSISRLDLLTHSVHDLCCHSERGMCQYEGTVVKSLDLIGNLLICIVCHYKSVYEVSCIRQVDSAIEEFS